MLNHYFMTLGSGSSPDPNIYYRTHNFQILRGEKDSKETPLFITAQTEIIHLDKLKFER